jgi:hypothetical protein
MKRESLFTSFCLLALLVGASCEHAEWDNGQTQNENSEVEVNDTTSHSEGGTSTRPGPTSGIGSFGEPYTIAEAQTAGTDSLHCWVVGYIVGYTYSNTMKHATFGIMDAVESNVLLADDSTQQNADACMPIELKSTKMKKALSLKDHPGGFRRQVEVYGYLLTYYRVRGLRGVSDYEWR